MSEVKKTFRIANEIQIHRLGFGAMRLCGEGIWHWPKNKPQAAQV